MEYGFRRAFSMDTFTLSRIQFACTTAFHYIFPPMSIGLGVLLVLMEGQYLRTKKPIYEQLTKFWVKIFGLIFAMGVATGIVLEFQFGTNWSAYSRYVGDIFGSILAAEAILAFFLESVFLGLLLFGWDKVKPRTHFLATCMVCLGSILSSVWIIVANSWMQTPAGYTFVESTGRAEIVDFWAVVFNPSSMIRLSHVLCGALQAGAFFVLSVCAYYLIKKRHEDFAKAAFPLALIVAFVASILQLGTGHFSAILIAKHQPAKFAAVEGHFESGPAPLYAAGWVDTENEKVYGIGAPGMASFLVYGDPNKSMPGLKSFPVEDRPTMLQLLFQSYHIMVALGGMMILLSLVGLWFWKRGTLYNKIWLLWTFVFFVLVPQIANQTGWIVAEVGRQPWIVYGKLRTAAAFSPNVPAEHVLASLIMLTLIYLLLLVLFLLLLTQKIKQGPPIVVLEPGAESKEAK